MNQEKYVDKLLIGILNVDSDESLEEALINPKDKLHVKQLGDLKVEVFGGEGQIPHMHINAISENGFHTCVCLYDNTYFAHGGKYRDKFNNSQLKKYVDWLDHLVEAAPGVKITNWDMACLMWKNSNPDCKFPDSKKTKTRPNYIYMTNFKEQ